MSSFKKRFSERFSQRETEMKPAAAPASRLQVCFEWIHEISFRLVSFLGVEFVVFVVWWRCLFSFVFRFRTLGSVDSRRRQRVLYWQWRESNTATYLVILRLLVVVLATMFCWLHRRLWKDALWGVVRFHRSFDAERSLDRRWSEAVVIWRMLLAWVQIASVVTLFRCLICAVNPRGRSRFLW